MGECHDQRGELCRPIREFGGGIRTLLEEVHDTLENRHHDRHILARTSAYTVVTMSPLAILSFSPTTLSYTRDGQVTYQFHNNTSNPGGTHTSKFPLL